MKKLLTAVVSTLLAGAAQAGLPTLNYTCPTNIELHTDAGGPAYINGKQAKLKKYNDNYYEVTGGGAIVSISFNQDGSIGVAYTGKHGANGLCKDTSPQIGGSDSSSQQSHHSESRAEKACRKAVARQVSVNARDIKVIGSEESQAGTSVRVSVPDAQAPWSCVIDTDGSVGRVEYMGEG